MHWKAASPSCSFPTGKIQRRQDKLSLLRMTDFGESLARQEGTAVIDRRYNCTVARKSLVTLLPPPRRGRFPFCCGYRWFYHRLISDGPPGLRAK